MPGISKYNLLSQSGTILHIKWFQFNRISITCTLFSNSKILQKSKALYVEQKKRVSGLIHTKMFITKPWLQQLATAKQHLCSNATVSPHPFFSGLCVIQGITKDSKAQLIGNVFVNRKQKNDISMTHGLIVTRCRTMFKTDYLYSFHKKGHLQLNVRKI